MLPSADIFSSLVRCEATGKHGEHKSPIALSTKWKIHGNLQRRSICQEYVPARLGLAIFFNPSVLPPCRSNFPRPLLDFRSCSIYDSEVPRRMTDRGTLVSRSRGQRRISVDTFVIAAEEVGHEETGMQRSAIAAHFPRVSRSNRNA